MYREKRSPSYPSHPGRANLSYISLQNLMNRLHRRQKDGSARRVTLLAGPGSLSMAHSPSSPGQLFSVWTLSLAQIGQLRWSETIRACASTVVTGKPALGPLDLGKIRWSTFFTYKRSLNLTRLGGWPLLPGVFSFSTGTLHTKGKGPRAKWSLDYQFSGSQQSGNWIWIQHGGSFKTLQKDRFPGGRAGKKYLGVFNTSKVA